MPNSWRSGSFLRYLDVRSNIERKGSRREHGAPHRPSLAESLVGSLPSSSVSHIVRSDIVWRDSPRLATARRRVGDTYLSALVDLLTATRISRTAAVSADNAPPSVTTAPQKCRELSTSENTRASTRYTALGVTSGIVQSVIAR